MRAPHALSPGRLTGLGATRDFCHVLLQPDRPSPPDPADPVGLCRTCRHARIVPARAGARYYRCARAATDPRYRKYPALPVRACDGYERDAAPAPPGEPPDAAR